MFSPDKIQQITEQLQNKISETFNPLIKEKLHEVANIVEYNFVKPKEECSTQTDVVDLFCDNRKMKRTRSINDYSNFELLAVSTPAHLREFVQELRDNVEFLTRSGSEVIEKYREVIPGLCKVIPTVTKQNSLIEVAEKQLRYLEKSFRTNKLDWLSCNVIQTDTTNPVKSDVIENRETSSLTTKSKERAQLKPSKETTVTSSKAETSSKMQTKTDKSKNKACYDKLLEYQDSDTDNYVVKKCYVKGCAFSVEVSKHFDFTKHYDEFHPDEKPEHDMRYFATNLSEKEYKKLQRVWQTQLQEFQQQN